MKNTGLAVFQKEEFGSVRVVTLDGEPWFVAADVCRALELEKTNRALSRLDDDEKGAHLVSTPGGRQMMSIVSESGLYALVLGSRKPEAKAFKRWITHEVIPAIRKRGVYITDEKLKLLAEKPEMLDVLIQALYILAAEKIQHDEEHKALLPKAEYYARDISKKIRSSHRLRGNMGEPLSQPPYGYQKSPENKKKWIIDPEAAEIVKRIFKMCLDGKGNETIARILQEQKVLVPMAYWQSKGLPRGGKKTQPNPYRWCKTTVQKILSQQEYCGDVINFKTYSKSFKNKRRYDNDSENWVIFKDVHEPIIAREDFEKVQARIAKTKRRAPKPHNGQKSIFADLLFCGDCHTKLRYHTNTINKDIHYFVCANNKVDYRGSCPGRHYVRSDAIEQVVMLELRRMAEYLSDDEDAFAELLARKTDKELLKEQKRCEEELQKAMTRNDTVSRLYEKLYEDNAIGKVSDEWFMQLSHKYEVERMELKSEITALRKKLSESGKQQQQRESFILAVRRFMQMDYLTVPLLRELIDHIDVFETEGTGKNRTQRIVINYRFVGYVEIPAAPRHPHYKADTRQGVAVEYLTEPKTA